MANSDFRDKMKRKRVEAEQKYQENSDEAWAQIRSFVSDPNHWIIMAIVLLLLVAGFFTLKFLVAIRAPSLPGTKEPTVLGGDSQTPGGVDAQDEIDDSNTVQPILSGARKEDYYTFLLIATDASSSNTDTLMVVSYDVKNQKLNLMSIPRDTMVNVSWDIKKINSVYAMSGMNGLRKHIGKLIGFVPDYYVKIDLNAFIEVVDLIGGVDFEVPRAMDYDDPAQNLHIHFQPGMQHLDGQQAMEVVRWRKNNRSASGGVSGYDDTGRIQTQQAFLKAALDQALSIRNWTKITGYVEIFQRDVESDLELGNMLWFARKAMDLSADGFMTCTIPGNYYASAWSRTMGGMQSYVTLNAQEVIKLVNESFNPYLANVSMANLDIMSINSDGSIRSSTGYVADGTAAQPPVVPRTEPEEEPDDPTGPDDTDAPNGTTAPNDTTAPNAPDTPNGPITPDTGPEPDTAPEPEAPSGPATEPEETPEPEAPAEPAPEPENANPTPPDDGGDIE